MTITQFRKLEELKGNPQAQLEFLKSELKESLDYEKTVEVAPPTGSWDHWPAGWRARRNYMTGLNHRRHYRRALRRKIRKIKAELDATRDRSVYRRVWRDMKQTELHRIKIDREGKLWTCLGCDGDFRYRIRPVRIVREDENEYVIDLPEDMIYGYRSRCVIRKKEVLS